MVICCFFIVNGLKRNLHIVLWLILGILLPGSAFSQDSVVCSGDYGMYAVSSDYSYSSTYHWNVEGGTIEQNYGNRIEVRWSGDAEEGRITVRERGLSGCESELKEYVVDLRGNFADLGRDEVICEGDSVRFAPGTDYESYRWQDGSELPYYVADSAGTYWVQVRDQYGCTDRDSVRLTVHDKPDVNIGVNTMYPERVDIFEDSVAFISDAVDYITLDAGRWNTYEWNTGDMMASIDVRTEDVARRPEEVETEYYWVTVSNEYGCRSSDTLAVTVAGSLEIPNAFTPNDDQANNLWKIPGLSMFPNCEVAIYDRWGSIVYRSKGYDEAAYWDGTDRSGKKLPMDSYYYVIDLGNGKEPITGTVSIIR